MKRTQIWMLALAAGAIVLAPALAEGRGPHGHRGPGFGRGEGRLAHMAEALDLTADQQEQFKTIHAKYRDGAMGETMDAMRDARQALGAMIHDPAASDEQVREAARAVGALEAQLAVEQHHMAGEIAAILTPEQREKARALHESRREHRGGGGPERGRF